MTRLFCISFLLFCYAIGYSQISEPVTGNNEEQLENITANDPNATIEDDSWILRMQQYIREPLDLNEATDTDLSEFGNISPIQIQQFISYRNRLGKFQNLYELQAIPGWDIPLIKKIQPYINVSNKKNIRNQLFGPGKREHILLFRVSQVVERSDGYLADSGKTNYYQGSPQKILMRYTFRLKKVLQAGILGEKDAGESFLKGKQKVGFDFYSFHVFIKHLQKIDVLALGDFTVNMGQGLIHWQSIGFKKSADIVNIKKQGPILRPYHSSGEQNFHRGFGITFSRKLFQATFFASYRQMDANRISDSTGNLSYVSSILTSGYHRTKAEAEDKGVERQFTFGGNLSYKKRSLHLGINLIRLRYSLPVQKPAEPYNLMAFSGNQVTNGSVDYSFTWRNMHFFGESAVNEKFKLAHLAGMLMSLSANADAAVLFRHISPEFHSFYSNAFTESSAPSGETGIYAGLCLRPGKGWVINAYADFFKYPWLKYLIDAPSFGRDYLVQLTYKPHKLLEINARFHSGIKSHNTSAGLSTMSITEAVRVSDWRLNLHYLLSKELAIRVRIEGNRILKTDPEQGYQTSIDLAVNPMRKRYSGSVRFQYFETGGYDSRIYGVENDVLYSFSIPAFYEKGLHYYLNFNYRFNKRVQLWCRFAQTIYPGKNSTGSGLDEIAGNRKSEIKLQSQYKF